MSMNSLIINKSGQQILLANDYGFWTFNKMLNDIDSIFTLLLEIDNIQFKYLDPILTLERGVLEKYADSINFSQYRNYEIYLDYLNMKSNGDFIDDEFIKHINLHFDVDYINRKTRYYLLQRSTRQLKLPDTVEKFNDRLFDLDRELSPKVHNNIPKILNNNCDIIVFLLCEVSIMLQQGLESMMYYLNLVEIQTFIEIKRGCENIRLLVSNRNVFEPYF